jgi:thymidylate synthase (FAD)
MGIEQIKATLIDHMGDDLRTSNSARVSFKKKREEFMFEGDPRVRPSGRSDEKLIHDLAAEGHIAPFGHSYALFHTKAPIFVARQLVKHKFLRWSEVSRRYVDDEPEFYVPDVWRGRSEDKKQGSEGVVNLDTWVVDRTYEGDFGKYEGELYDVDSYNDLALDMYKGLIRQQVAPEQARMVLPQSTMTEWYWSGSLDAFAAMCKLRCASDTQYESRVVADQISKVMSELYPVSWGSLMEIEHG